ncbi:hypothetical protein D3C85_783490 [compost metagenome]
MLTDIGTSTIDLQEGEDENIFTPDRDKILPLVEDLYGVLGKEPHRDMRVLDIIVALDSVSAYLKETIQVAGMVEVVE